MLNVLWFLYSCNGFSCASLRSPLVVVVVVVVVVIILGGSGGGGGDCCCWSGNHIEPNLLESKTHVS